MEEISIDNFIYNHDPDESWYSQVLIIENGNVLNAMPSHTEALIELYGKKRDVIYNEIPASDETIDYLLDKTKCLAVWYNCVIGYDSVSNSQIDSFKKLISSNVISGSINKIVVPKLNRHLVAEAESGATSKIKDDHDGILQWELDFKF